MHTLCSIFCRFTLVSCSNTEKLFYNDNNNALPDLYNLLNGYVEDPTQWPEVNYPDIYRACESRLTSHRDSTSGDIG